MNCKKVQAMLPELVSGELNSKVHSDVMDHINICPGCRVEMENCEAALGALSSSWTPVQTPAALDSLSLSKTSRASFTIAKLGFVGVCLAAIVAAVIFIPRFQNIKETRQASSSIRSQEDNEIQHSEPLKIQSEKKTEDEIKPEVQQKDTLENQPAIKIEKQEHKWDERRFRPRKQWEYCAYNNRKPESKPVAVKPEPIEQIAVVPSEPLPEQVEHSNTANAKPCTHKVNRQIATYDRYGNKQITITETEEQSQPCTMALY